MGEIVTFEKFDLERVSLTKFLFFTGKGGVGKTSVACSTAVTLADKGFKVLLISTDPASNLQDVFEMELTNTETKIDKVNNLWLANLDPILAAQQYREQVINPYVGKLPESILKNMEEQLSGSCTVEIAAFNEFTKYLVDEEKISKFDYIIFDTAPTGHTLRMLQLPSAWDSFISESTHGASCLGQLSGLEENKQMYSDAVATLCDKQQTTILLVTRPETSPLLEATRASKELSELGIMNQLLIVNGLLDSEAEDEIEKAMFLKQQNALNEMPRHLNSIKTFEIPLRSYNITGIESLRNLLISDEIVDSTNYQKVSAKNIHQLIKYLRESKKRIIFAMGKGGVGKTTMASTIALGLAEKGEKVHLTTTDPANHLRGFLGLNRNITMSEIDEKEELLQYQNEVLTKARETMKEEDLDYIKEDLQSPCTQEIAVFRAFANIVERSNDEIVVIDTAPTGHTLLLLDSTQSYHKEMERSHGDIPESVRNLLPRLKNEEETEVVIVTLAEATPYYEATRLKSDLKRAGIFNKWWIINASLGGTKTNSKILNAKAASEVKWINEIVKESNDSAVIIPWISENVDEHQLRILLNENDD